MKNKGFTNEEIEEFIDRFRFYQYNHKVKNRDIKIYLNVPLIISDQFLNGYCYHFAHMLKNIFNNKGKVIYLFPHEHFVWYYKGRYYDCAGEFDNIDQNDKIYFKCEDKELPRDLLEKLYFHKKKEDIKKVYKYKAKMMDYVFDQIEKSEEVTVELVENTIDFICDSDEKLKDIMRTNSKWYKNFIGNMTECI